MEIKDVSEGVKNVQFNVFKQALEKKGVVRGIRVEGGADFSRMEIENFTKFAGQFGAKGLAWMKHADTGLESSIIKFFNKQELDYLKEVFSSKPGDILFFVADKRKTAAAALGALRTHIIEYQKLTPKMDWSLVWVVDFPLIEWSEEDRRFTAIHHPFTAPRLDDMDLLKEVASTVSVDESLIEKASGIKARAYDIVLNGTEIGGGSIRIHRSELQHLIFELLKINKEEAATKFGFLLDALEYGAPPHGGIALGLDRLTAILSRSESIRDTVAFPKTQRAACMLTGAPDAVSLKQLKELSLNVIKMPGKDKN